MLEEIPILRCPHCEQYMDCIATPSDRPDHAKSFDYYCVRCGYSAEYVPPEQRKREEKSSK